MYKPGERKRQKRERERRETEERKNKRERERRETEERKRRKKWKWGWFLFSQVLKKLNRDQHVCVGGSYCCKCPSIKCFQINPLKSPFKGDQVYFLSISIWRNLHLEIDFNFGPIFNQS
jgi:hypothetical protein